MSAPSRPTESLEALLAGTCQVDERELRDSLRTLIENVGGMTYRCLPDQSWTMLYVSESAEAITGYTVEDLLSGRQSYEALILPEDRPSVRDEVDAARATGCCGMPAPVRAPRASRATRPLDAPCSVRERFLSFSRLKSRF